MSVRKKKPKKVIGSGVSSRKQCCFSGGVLEKALKQLIVRIVTTGTGRSRPITG
jgi:hypothetical protein